MGANQRSAATLVVVVLVIVVVVRFMAKVSVWPAKGQRRQAYNAIWKVSRG